MQHFNLMFALSIVQILFIKVMQILLEIKGEYHQIKVFQFRVKQLVNFSNYAADNELFIIKTKTKNYQKSPHITGGCFCI